MQALPHNPLIRGLCRPGQGQNDKILSQLALDAQSDPVLKDSLSRSLAQADVSKRSIARTLNLSRYALSKPPDKPPKSPWRKGDRYYTQEEDTYVRDWIHLRLVPLNDLSDKATRQGPTGREEHQKFQDFLGSTQMHRDFHREHELHSRLSRVSRPKIRELYPWYWCKGKHENCVCHIHYGLCILLADYHYNSPRFHRHYASQFSKGAPSRQTISCVTCKDHPFNGPKRFGSDNERRRTLHRPSEAMRVLLCPDATTPGPKASVACCRNECPKCGWKRVAKCPAEWSDSGEFEWRALVYQETAKGKKEYTVRRMSGTPREQMEALESAILAFPIHEFLSRWQAWAFQEIPRQMPEDHYMTVADYIMKYKHGEAFRKRFQGAHFVHHTVTILCFVTQTVNGPPGPTRTVTNHGYSFLTYAPVPPSLPPRPPRTHAHTHTHTHTHTSPQNTNIPCLFIGTLSLLFQLSRRSSPRDSSTTVLVSWRRI
jgi:hypothetical protein